jgi:rod shape determining protein RodA
MIRVIAQKLRGLDWVLIGCLSALFLIGLATLYGTPGEKTAFYKQLMFGALALLLLLAGSLFDYRSFRDRPLLLVVLYGGGVGALLLLLLIGAKVRGVAGWFQIGGIAVQPVELVKIFVILALAKYLSVRHVELYRLRHLFISGLYVLVPVSLVMLQPDLGSAVVLIAVWVGLIVISGIRVREFLLIIAAGILAAVLLWSFGLQEYQRDRILAFLSPGEDPLGSAYQTRQAMIAIGSGGLFGKGLGEGSQTRLGFLPEYETDFIFAAIGEEWGLLGALLVLVLWGVIFWRMYRLWDHASNNFARLYIGGVLVLLATHVILNVGANVGWLPVTGLPLPFVSAGGSNLLSLALGMSIVLSIKVRSTLPRELVGRREDSLEVLEA